MQSLTWKKYDDVQADWVSVRSSISRSSDDLKATRLVINKPTDGRSRDDGLVVYPGEITRS